jgi:hypothetical protein
MLIKVSLASLDLLGQSEEGSFLMGIRVPSDSKMDHKLASRC